MQHLICVVSIDQDASEKAKQAFEGILPEDTLYIPCWANVAGRQFRRILVLDYHRMQELYGHQTSNAMAGLGSRLTVDGTIHFL